MSRMLVIWTSRSFQRDSWPWSSNSNSLMIPFTKRSNRLSKGLYSLSLETKMGSLLRPSSWRRNWSQLLPSRRTRLTSRKSELSNPISRILTSRGTSSRRFIRSWQTQLSSWRSFWSCKSLCILWARTRNHPKSVISSLRLTGWWQRSATSINRIRHST